MDIQTAIGPHADESGERDYVDDTESQSSMTSDSHALSSKVESSYFSHHQHEPSSKMKENLDLAF
jgi:hypothetical protein